MNTSRFIQVCLALLLIVGMWSWVNPHDRLTWWLEAFPIFIGLPLLFGTYKKLPLTKLLYGLLTIHAIILLVGAHYTYAQVPLFDWVKDVLGGQRNNYDKVGHFAQGFVPAMLVRELLLRTTPLKATSYWLPCLIIMSMLGFSAVYELLEFAVAMWLNSAADAFLGSQGDIWDTQKDILWAGIGAVVALVGLSRWHDRQLNAPQS